MSTVGNFKISYLILAHNNPNQLERLVSRLQAPWCKFYIHLDKKADIKVFRDHLSIFDNINYVAEENRVNGRWGDLSLVSAVLECMKLCIMEDDKGPCILLSGQDYPLRTQEYIRDFFLKYPDNNYMSIYPIPDPKKRTENGGLERLESYTFDCRNPKNPRMKAKIRPLSLNPKTVLGFYRILKYRKDILPFALRCFFKKRSYPMGLSKTFNEMWCVLNRRTAEYLLSTINEYPEYLEYYKYTHIPDETMFSAILFNNESIRQTIKPMCHYINWESGSNGSPKTLDVGDFSNIKKCIFSNNHVLFARKFNENAQFLNDIDIQLLNRKK